VRGRRLLAGASAALVATAGCAALREDRPAHTVSVYLGDRETTRDVRAWVYAADGTELFDRATRLSDANEADEDATFPARVVVAVDGTRVERPWPDAGCDGPNRAGVEVYVEGGSTGTPEVRLERNCRSVTLDG
jgi:hypothetical protein